MGIDRGLLCGWIKNGVILPGRRWRDVDGSSPSRADNPRRTCGCSGCSAGSSVSLNEERSAAFRWAQTLEESLPRDISLPFAENDPLCLAWLAARREIPISERLISETISRTEPDSTNLIVHSMYAWPEVLKRFKVLRRSRANLVHLHSHMICMEYKKGAERGRENKCPAASCKLEFKRIVNCISSISSFAEKPETKETGLWMMKDVKCQHVKYNEQTPPVICSGNGLVRIFLPRKILSSEIQLYSRVFSPRESGIFIYRVRLSSICKLYRDIAIRLGEASALFSFVINVSFPQTRERDRYWIVEELFQI